MSTQNLISRLRSVQLKCSVALVALAAVLVPAAASAQHRAEMSSGVRRHLNAAQNKTIDVIVALPESVVQRLERQYGVKVKDVIDGAGTVLTVKPQQLDR